MAYSRAQTRFLGGLVLIAVLVADQWSKAGVVEFSHIHFFPYEITSFFSLVVAHNQGVSFGMLGHGNTALPLIITLFTSAVVVMLAVWWARAAESGVILGLSFIIGGAVGNILDRARFGAVTDFLDFHWRNHHWPAFNVADSCIFIGVVILLLLSIVAPAPVPKKD